MSASLTSAERQRSYRIAAKDDGMRRVYVWLPQHVHAKLDRLSAKSTRRDVIIRLIEEATPS